MSYDVKVGNCVYLGRVCYSDAVAEVKWLRLCGISAYVAARCRRTLSRFP